MEDVERQIQIQKELRALRRVLERISALERPQLESMIPEDSELYKHIEWRDSYAAERWRWLQIKRQFEQLGSGRALPAELKRARLTAGMTQRDLANAMNINRQSDISAYEKGKKELPRWYIEKLQQVTGTTITTKETDLSPNA